MIRAKKVKSEFGDAATPLVTYEQRLSANRNWALNEGSDYFQGGSSVRKALEKIVKRLDERAIPYALVGGLALFEYGYRRFTEDVDLLVTTDGFRQIHEELDGFGYRPAFKGSKQFRDTELGVTIEFQVEGQFPGDGKPKPVAFPNPVAVSVEKDRLKIIKLPTLIDLKLASGMTNLHCRRDLVDVMELITRLKLPENFSGQLNPFVRLQYSELWRDAQTPDFHNEEAEDGNPHR